MGQNPQKWPEKWPEKAQQIINAVSEPGRSLGDYKMKKQNAGQPLRFRFLPSLFAVDDATYKGAFKLEPVKALYNLGFDVRPVATVDDAGLFLWQVADSFLTELSRTEGLELSRENTEVPLTDDLAESLLLSLPFAPGSENVNVEWVKKLWTKLNGCFAEEIKNYSASVALYLAEKDEHLKVAERIFFHLVENKNDEKYPFSFLATYSTKGEKGSIKHAPLKYALTEYKSDRDKILELLSCLNRAAEVSKLINDFTSSGEMFHPLRLTANEAWQILRDIPKIEESGIVCRIPDWWKKSRQKARVSVSLTKKESLLGLSTILGMEGYLEVDGQKLSKTEIKKMLAMDEGLSLIKGKWVEVDHERLNLLLKEMEKYQGDISMMEALRMSLDSDSGGSDKKDQIDINAITAAAITATANTAAQAIVAPLLPDSPLALAESCGTKSIGANAAPIGVTRYTGLYTFKSILGSNLILYKLSIIRVFTFN